MLTNPQDSVNYGGMVPTSQMVPVPTGIPSQPSKCRSCLITFPRIVFYFTFFLKCYHL